MASRRQFLALPVVLVTTVALANTAWQDEEEWVDPEDDPPP
jgi:hypothetical protein